LANVDDLPGGASASWSRDAKAVVGYGNPKEHSGALLGLFSLVTLFAHQGMERSTEAVRRVAWYVKPHLTFSDVLAVVRKELWATAAFRELLAEPDTVKVPRAFVEHLTETLCCAA
jgi:hypothetical protein